MLFPNIVYAAAFVKLKFRLGVVFELSTVVVNKGAKLPAVKFVTDPPLPVAVKRAVVGSKLNPLPMVTGLMIPDPSAYNTLLFIPLNFNPANVGLLV